MRRVDHIITPTSSAMMVEALASGAGVLSHTVHTYALRPFHCYDAQAIGKGQGFVLVSRPALTFLGKALA